MLKAVPIGQYVPGESPLHRLDPRTKVLLLLAYVTVIFVATNVYGHVLLGAFAAAGIGTAGLPLRVYWRGLRPVLLLIGITFLLQVFVTPGEEAFRIGPVKATTEGVVKGLFMAMRLIFLIVSTSLLTLTTSPIDLTDGLERLLRPLRRVRLPAHELAMMMTIALRFIPTLLDEAERIMKAQMARGADFHTGSPLRRARSMVPILVPLFVSSFRRADELALAMETRCYRGGENRTRLKQLRPGTGDWGVAVLGAALVAAVVWSRFW